MAGEPAQKRLKTETSEDDEFMFFTSFLNDKNNRQLISDLKECLLDLQRKTLLSFLRVQETNATLSLSFKFATCKVDYIVDEENVPVIVPMGLFFLHGCAVLDGLLDKQPKVVTNAAQRRSLNDLLQFLSNDRSVLTENRDKCDKESELAVWFAEHLMIPLVPLKSYIIDSSYMYRGLDLHDCCTSSQSAVNGKEGDTSFGCAEGWHGRSDILFKEQQVPCSVMETADDSDSASGVSDSTIEVKLGNNIPITSLQKILAQTIVFSFLLFNQTNSSLNPSLVPGIGISAEKLVLYLYDCKGDVLLASSPIQLFFGKRLRLTPVLVLWLVLNHKLFCSGVPDEYKKFSSTLHEKLGPEYLKMYQTENFSPLHVQQTDYDILPLCIGEYPRRGSVVVKSKFPKIEFKDLEGVNTDT